MAMIAIAAVQAAIDIGTVVYRLMNKPRQPTPQLRDMEYMSGANGAPLPFGYGSVRTAGQVIWTSGVNYFKLGKGNGTQAGIGITTGGIALGSKGSYAFYASVAVGFGEGPAVISRIWGDSKLIYDANPTQSNAIPVTYYPAWVNTKLYNPGNQVNHSGAAWQALKTNKNSAPTQTNVNWVIISSYPPWSNSTEYLSGDIVSFNGQLYLAQISSNDGTVGAITPGSGATANVGSENVLYWILLTQIYHPPTIYPGDNLQLPDSLIQASEGATLTPAYRGLCYVVFENLLLVNFADRIPNFRAEVTYTKVATLL
jgi:hypothetical protein